MLREMPLAALLPIRRDACPLYYPQKSAEPAPTKRLRAFLGTEAALGAAVAATASLAALFMREPLVAACTYAILALLGVSSLRRVDLSLVSGLSLSVRSSTRPPRAPGLHPHGHGEPTPCSSHTAAAAVAGHPPASPAVAGGSRAATATEQTQQGALAVQVIGGLCWVASRTLGTLDQR